MESKEQAEERMFVDCKEFLLEGKEKCKPSDYCESPLMYIGTYDDDIRLKVESFELTCKEGHKRNYARTDIMKENACKAQLKSFGQINKVEEFKNTVKPSDLGTGIKP